MEEAKARNVNVGSGECKITYVICAKRRESLDCSQDDQVLI